MPRFFVKIPMLLLHDNGEFPVAVAEALHQLDLADEEYTQVPGVSVKSGEITLDADTIVNYELWIVKRVQDIDVEHVLQGSDAVMLVVDGAEQGAASLACEYLAIIDTRLHRIPAMIVNIHAGSPVTCHDMAFLREIWAAHVAECCSVNRSCPGRIQYVIEVIARGIVFHKDAGPVDLATGWIREAVTWQAMQRCIDKETVTTADKAFLGRNFLVLSLVRARHSSLEAHVLAAIATRWLEQAGDYMLAARVAEQLGDNARTRLLKRKHLHVLVTTAAAEFKRLQFKEAAARYEEAAFWNRIEFVDPAQLDELFTLAIDAWMSAFEFSKLPDLLAQVKSPATTLSRLKDKAFRGLDYLVQHDQLEKANAQAGTLVNVYLRHDLRETANELAARHARVKLALLASKLEQKFMGDAMLLVEEIGDLDTQFSLGVTVPPELLVTACVYLVHEGSFAAFEKLLPLVTDPLKQKELLARRVVREHELQEEARQAREDREKNAYLRLLAYKEEEQEDALRYAKTRREILFQLIEQGKADRAMSFAAMNARWLVDLAHDRIGSDLVVQACKHAVKHDHLVDLRAVQDLLVEGGMDDIVQAIVDRCGEIAASSDVAAAPAILDHFQRALRTVHRYAEADGVAPHLAATLVRLASTLAADPGNDIDTVTGVLDRLGALQRASPKALLEPAALDPVLETIVGRCIEDGNASGAEAHLHKITSLDTRKRLQQVIDARNEQKVAVLAERYKQKEAARILKERLQETTRTLLLDQDTLPERRASRLAALERDRDAGGIPGTALCFVQDPAALGKDDARIATVQDAAIARAAGQGDMAGVAMATLVAVMLAVKGNRLDAARAALGAGPPGLEPHLLAEARNHPAASIASSLLDAIDLGAGAEIEAALKASELLPLVQGERFLAYLILGRPVPASARVVEKRDRADQGTAFKETALEVFPYLLDIVSVALEPVRESLEVRREMLDRQGKLSGAAALRAGRLETATLQYQAEAYTFFDEGDVYLGWTSMLVAVLAMVRQGTGGREAAMLFKSAIASVPGKDDEKGLQDHPMYSLLSLYLKCVELGLAEEAATISKAAELLPLLDVERDAVAGWVRR